MRNRRSVALAFVATVSLVAAACGDDEDDAADTTTAATETTAATTSPPDTGGTETTTGDTAAETTAPEGTETTATDGTDTTAAPGGDDGASAVPEETGPADDSLEPVVIGYMNIDDGVPSFPATTAGFEAGVAYANDRLGGIGGRPIEVETCSVGLDDASIQACAQEFANSDAVQVIASGFVINSGGPQYPILEAAGKGVLVGNPLQVPDLTSPVAVSHMPGNPGISAGLPYFLARYLGAESIAVVVSDNDAGRGAIQLVEQVPYLQEQGVEIRPVFVSDDEVDYTGPITAAGAETAEAFLPLVAQSGCIQVANALDSLGLDVPVASTGLCADQTVLDAVGDLVDGWYIGFAGTPALADPGTDPEVDLYNELFGEYGDEADRLGAGATIGFGQALVLWEVGNAIGADSLSAESWLEGLQAFDGPVFLGPRSSSCPGPVFPSVCSSQSRVYQLTGGQFVDATEGEVLDPFGGG